VASEQGRKDMKSSGSVTNDEEDNFGHCPVKRIVPISSIYGDLIPDEGEFSQFDI
jgi:hypothetical protein